VLGLILVAAPVGAAISAPGGVTVLSVTHVDPWLRFHVEFGRDGVIQSARAHATDDAQTLATGLYDAARAFAGSERQLSAVDSGMSEGEGNSGTLPGNGGAAQCRQERRTWISRSTRGTSGA
jgi:hypothetical protein